MSEIFKGTDMAILPRLFITREKSQKLKRITSLMFNKRPKFDRRKKSRVLLGECLKRQNENARADTLHLRPQSEVREPPGRVTWHG